MEGIPVLDVKEAPPAREDVRLVIAFDAEALPGVEPAEPLLELLEEVGTHQFITCLARLGFGLPRGRQVYPLPRLLRNTQ
jgi:hypothetical protein